MEASTAIVHEQPSDQTVVTITNIKLSLKVASQESLDVIHERCVSQFCLIVTRYPNFLVIKQKAPSKLRIIYFKRNNNRLPESAGTVSTCHLNCTGFAAFEDIDTVVDLVSQISLCPMWL